MTAERTRVAIVGAGPAGLLLSHMLAEAGIDSIIVDSRDRESIESTIRAGILEQGTVELLEKIPHSRVHEIGDRHDGIELHFDDEAHRIDFKTLIDRSVWLYPQHEVLKDLIAARLEAGQDLRFGARVTAVEGAETDSPRVLGTDADGNDFEIVADFVVGADGSHSAVRPTVTGSRSSGHFREYPFAWFGVLAEAPMSAEELIYSNSPDGFALISQRSPSVQRMYFQCDPLTDPESLSESEIWDILQRRTPGHDLKEGHIFQRDVLRFRSFVASELRHGRVALVGDAAHTVPPTGAKGMNLAIADVVLLNEALRRLLTENDASGIDNYSEAARKRIWKSQHFSWWMTSMLHLQPEASEFDRLRQLGELRSVVDSEAGKQYLAEAYTGWPLRTDV
ncbi:4-hydroxybenzoate 3-monooxygenase [Leucobacter sp. GX0328]